MFRASVCLLVLTACSVCALTAQADPPRNCPIIADQVVNVQGGQPVVFTLSIENPVGSSISIFQYPLGGVTEQNGPTPLDFTFIPGSDFSGSTTLTYRVTPPVGCTHSAMLGKVTLVGGPATSTASGLEVDSTTGLTPAPQNDQSVQDLITLLALTRGSGGLCGLGLFAPVLLTAAGLSIIQRRSRR